MLGPWLLFPTLVGTGGPLVFSCPCHPSCHLQDYDTTLTWTHLASAALVKIPEGKLSEKDAWHGSYYTVRDGPPHSSPHAVGSGEIHTHPQPIPAAAFTRARDAGVTNRDGAHAPEPAQQDRQGDASRSPTARGGAGTPRGLSRAHRNTARGTVPSVRKGKGTTSVPGHQLAVRAPSPIGLIAEFTLFTLGELASAAAWQ